MNQILPFYPDTQLGAKEKEGFYGIIKFVLYHLPNVASNLFDSEDMIKYVKYNTTSIEISNLIKRTSKMQKVNKIKYLIEHRLNRHEKNTQELNNIYMKCKIITENSHHKISLTSETDDKIGKIFFLSFFEIFGITVAFFSVVKRKKSFNDSVVSDTVMESPNKKIQTQKDSPLSPTVDTSKFPYPNRVLHLEVEIKKKDLELEEKNGLINDLKKKNKNLKSSIVETSQKYKEYKKEIKSLREEIEKINNQNKMFSNNGGHQSPVPVSQDNLNNLSTNSSYYYNNYATQAYPYQYYSPQMYSQYASMYAGVQPQSPLVTNTTTTVDLDKTNQPVEQNETKVIEIEEDDD